MTNFLLNNKFHRNILLTTLLLFSFFNLSFIATAEAKMPDTIRIATFNVSMEALNYVDRGTKVTGNELSQVLREDNQQIKNIAEIIQRINPDIILLNEFDYVNDDNIRYFLENYVAKSQHGQTGIKYPFFYQGSVNTGVKVNHDLNRDGKTNQQPSDTHGFGHFEGHFGMVLLSKYPINNDKIRTFQHFKWHDMPNALQPKDPETGKPWYSKEAWQALRLSSKSHWDIPVTINNQTVHLLASHPTPPVFDGPENRNGKRNHDEIRFWFDYISGNKGQYIYDDSGVKGGIAPQQTFVILGDQNASTIDGDAITEANSQGIVALLNSDKIQDPMPASTGAKLHSPEKEHGKHHTAYWGMRADYVLPSKQGFTLLNSGVFWPEKEHENYRLIKDRQASSDHRLVWVDVELTQ